MSNEGNSGFPFFNFIYPIFPFYSFDFRLILYIYSPNHLYYGA